MCFDEKFLKKKKSYLLRIDRCNNLHRLVRTHVNIVKNNYLNRDNAVVKQ